VPKTMNCPNCDALLNLQDSDAQIKCPNCGSTVIVSDDMQGAVSIMMNALGDLSNLDALKDKAKQFKRVKELIEAGNKIEAIKVYRELTGVGLKESKDAVDAMEAGKPVMLTNSQAFSQTFSGNDDKELLDEINRHLHNGNKIEAIKVYREKYKVGLKEAKDAVESMEAGQSIDQTSSQAFAPTTAGFGTAAMAEIDRLMRAGNKIEAIKVYREKFNVGLKEAKDAVEAMEMGLPPTTTSPFSQYASSEPVISANPFDEPQKEGRRINWWGPLIIAVVFLFGVAMCITLAISLGIFNK
jgi:ribosomal protein L7/L12